MTLLLFAIRTVRQLYHAGPVDNCDLAALGVDQPPIFKHLQGYGDARAPGAKHGAQKLVRQVDPVAPPYASSTISNHWASRSSIFEWPLTSAVRDD